MFIFNNTENTIYFHKKYNVNNIEISSQTQ